jgi:adenylosuccinate synthase
MKMTAVIGANFGDEGKGRTVDALADKDTLVVRFNGGAQAGHTVVANGKRHVFSHFGSGTLQGAPTFLSRFFVVNPFVFYQEWMELQQLGVTPTVMIDPACPMTTPYEIAVNRALERSRGNARHGSCGQGFGETLEREQQKVSVKVGGNHWLDEVRAHAIKRQNSLGLVRELGGVIHDADTRVSQWYDCLEFMKAHSTILPWDAAALGGGSRRNLLFEGAQGLLLHQDHEFFPHVTRSRTGIQNVVALANDLALSDKEIEAVYVTRTYLTRHGAGPLPGEDPELSYPDATNEPGEFQGTLRFAPLDLDLLSKTVHDDCVHYPEVEPVLAVTCLDQHGGLLLTHEIEETIGLPVRYVSYGPQRADFMERKLKSICRQNLISGPHASM